MPRSKTRKRKEPLTLASSAAKPTDRSTGASHRATQSLISSYHVLLKRRQQLEQDIAQSPEEHRVSLQSQWIELDDKIRRDHEAYQKASQLGQSEQRGGDSSKVLLGWLKELGYQNLPTQLRPSPVVPVGQKPTRWRLLELGAVSPSNFEDAVSWIHNHPIDLNSTHPEILQQDFFERPLPNDVSSQFDVISCSLVLNFVSSPQARGNMLRLAHQHLKPSPTSLIFLVLPASCVQNSRYFNMTIFTQLMRAVGFQLTREKVRPGGKLGYWLWTWREPDNSVDSNSLARKRVVREGSKRNNFAVVLAK